MGIKEKATNIVLDIVREMYAEIGFDFDSNVENSEEGWFNHFYLPMERQEAIVKKHLKYQRKFVREVVNWNVWLKCSPSSRDFYYELTKEEDSSFLKTSKRVRWVENDDNEVLKPFILPSLGRSLLMSPFSDSFTWFTTPIVEIIETDKRNRVEFKTKNSHYYLEKVLV
jgi:hypothetical protein